jgi:hypothetical protein
MPEQISFRDKTISLIMPLLSTAIKSSVTRMGVPKELQTNCFWAVKKYMRKVLYDLSDGELEEIQTFMKSVFGNDVLTSTFSRCDFTNTFPVSLTDLIESAIQGYLNYRKAKVIRSYSISVPFRILPPQFKK